VRGARDSGTNWGLSLVTGGLSYASPGKMHVRAMVAFGRGWYSHDEGSAYASRGVDGLIGGLGIGYALSDRTELLLHSWLVGEVRSEGETVGYVYRLGARVGWGL